MKTLLIAECRTFCFWSLLCTKVPASWTIFASCQVTWGIKYCAAFLKFRICESSVWHQHLNVIKIRLSVRSIIHKTSSLGFWSVLTFSLLFVPIMTSNPFQCFDNVFWHWLQGFRTCQCSLSYRQFETVRARWLTFVRTYYTLQSQYLPNFIFGSKVVDFWNIQEYMYGKKHIKCALVVWKQLPMNEAFRWYVWVLLSACYMLIVENVSGVFAKYP